MAVGAAVVGAFVWFFGRQAVPRDVLEKKYIDDLRRDLESLKSAHLRLKSDHENQAIDVARMRGVLDVLEAKDKKD